MAIELEVKCSNCPNLETIAVLTQLVLRDRFSITDEPIITISPDGDFVIVPHAHVKILHYDSRVPVSTDPIEGGYYVCISMNPARTPQSFLLGLAIALALAQANSTNILDEATLLKQGRWVSPDAIQTQCQPDTFDKVAQIVAQEFGIFQKKI